MTKTLVHVQLAHVASSTHLFAESLRAGHRSHGIDVSLEYQSRGKSLAHMLVGRDVVRAASTPQEPLYPAVGSQRYRRRHEDKSVGLRVAGIRGRIPLEYCRGRREMGSCGSAVRDDAVRIDA